METDKLPSLSGSPGVLRYFAGAGASENTIFVFSSAERLSRFCNTQPRTVEAPADDASEEAQGALWYTFEHLNKINPFVKLAPQ